MAHLCETSCASRKTDECKCSVGSVVWKISFYFGEFFNLFSLRIISKLFWRGTITWIISVYRMFDSREWRMVRQRRVQKYIDEDPGNRSLNKSITILI